MAEKCIWCLENLHTFLTELGHLEGSIDLESKRRSLVDLRDAKTPLSRVKEGGCMSMLTLGIIQDNVGDIGNLVAGENWDVAKKRTTSIKELTSAVGYPSVIDICRKEEAKKY